MNESFEVRIADPTGHPLDQIANFGSSEGAALDYVLNVGKPSALTLTVPASYNDRAFVLDGQVTVWRRSGGYGPFHDGQATFLVRKWRYLAHSTIITAIHANSLMSRRFVLYDKNTTFAEKTPDSYADNYIKQLWRENAGDLVDSSRDGSDLQTNISTIVGTDEYTSSSGVTGGQFSRRRVSEAIRELAESAAYATGTVYLAVEIVGAVDGSLTFKTFPLHRGADRRMGTSRPVLLSDEDGSLSDAELVIDRTEEVTVVAALGAGDTDLRLKQVAIDLKRMEESPLNRIEKTLNLSNISDDAELLSAAYAELKKGEPKIYVTGAISESSPYIRGVDYDYGDLVSVRVRGRTLSCRLDSIRTTIGHDSRTTRIILQGMNDE